MPEKNASLVAIKIDQLGQKYGIIYFMSFDSCLLDLLAVCQCLSASGKGKVGVGRKIQCLHSLREYGQ